MTATTQQTSSRRTHPLAIVVVAQLVYALGAMLGQLAALPVYLPFSAEPPLLVGMGVMLLATTLSQLPIIGLLWLWLRYFEKRPFATIAGEMGLSRTGIWRCHAIGLATGVAFTVGWAGLQFAIGNMRVEEWLWTPGNPVLLLALYIPVLYINRVIMIASEEILFRGWTLRETTRRWGVLAGLTVSSLSFAAFHFVNPLLLMGPLHTFEWPLAINLVLWSVLAATLTLITKNLWAAIAFHAAPLALASGAIVVQTSSQPVSSPALLLVTQPHASPLWGEGALAGPFTGLPTTVLLLIACLIAMSVAWRQSGTVTLSDGTNS